MAQFMPPDIADEFIADSEIDALITPNISFKDWMRLRETEVVYDGSKATTFNYEGAVAKGIKSIDGKPIKNDKSKSAKSRS